jgi:hypothetical protein
VLIGRTTNIGQADPKYSERFGKHLRDLFIAELTAGTNTTVNFPIDQIPGILLLGCSVISVAFYNLCGYFSLLMPYWL